MERFKYRTELGVSVISPPRRLVTTYEELPRFTYRKPTKWEIAWHIILKVGLIILGIIVLLFFISVIAIGVKLMGWLYILVVVMAGMAFGLRT